MYSRSGRLATGRSGLGVAVVKGRMQDGGHVREVLAKAGLMVFFWFWLRMMVTVLPLCLTSAEAIFGVIFTATSAALAVVNAPNDMQATRAVDVMIFAIFITVFSFGLLLLLPHLNL